MVAVYHIIQSGLLGAIFITNNPEIREFGYVTTPIVVVNTKDEPALIDYARKSAKPTVSLNFQQTLLKTKPAPAVHFEKSFKKLSGPFEVRYNGPGVIGFGCLASEGCSRSNWVQCELTLRLQFDIRDIHGLPSCFRCSCATERCAPRMECNSNRSALMTTANPLDTTRNPILDDGDNFNSASPLAMGTGHIDPYRALEPGLIYDATSQEYFNLFCSVNFTRKQSYPSLDHAPMIVPNHLPIFISIFRRIVHSSQNKDKGSNISEDCDKCVGDGASRYMDPVIAPKGSKVTVSPDILIFAHKYEKEKGKALYGTLVWIEQNRKYTVRSSLV